jgi:hypothetical protein
MRFDKKTRTTLIVIIFIVILLAKFVPTLMNSYTNSDSPAHFANALFVTIDKDVNYPVEIFHYKFDSKFKLSGLASVSVDAYLPLPPLYLFYLYPFFKIFSPLTGLSILYFLTALFSSLNALLIYFWVKKETNNDSSALISAFIFGVMPIGYLFYSGGDFPQIMGQFFVLVAIYSVRRFYDKILDKKYFILLTAIILVSLLIHLGSTIGLLSILGMILIYKGYKLFSDHKKEKIMKIISSDSGKKLFFYGLSVLIAFILSYFLYFGYFLDLFIAASTKSTTGTFFIPQLDQIYQLFRGYWFFVLFIPFGWFVLKEKNEFRAYLYLWFFVSLVYFIMNIEIRYVYLIYQPIAIISGITLGRFFDHSKFRKYVIYSLIILFIATLIYSSTWWTYFAKTGYSAKIFNLIQTFRP